MAESQAIASLSELCAALKLHDEESNAVDVSSIEQMQYNSEDVSEIANLLEKGLGMEVALSWQGASLWVEDEWDQELRYPFTMAEFWQTVYGLRQSEGWRALRVEGIERGFVGDNQQFSCAGITWRVTSHYDAEKVWCTEVLTGNTVPFSWSRVTQCMGKELLEPSAVVKALLLAAEG